MIVEIGLAVVLVVMVGMYTRLFAEFDRIDWGFDPTKVMAVTLSVDHGPERREADARLLAGIVDEVTHAPGVRVAAAGGVPGPGMPGSSSGHAVEFEGCASATGNRTGQTVVVGPGYFAALGLPVGRGRGITAQDTAGAPPVGVISESHAAACWPGQDPLGRRFRMRGAAAAPWVTVVGVVPDTMVTRLQPDGFQHVYVPYEQRGELPETLLVRSDGDVSALAGTVRAAVRRADATQPLDRVGRLDTVIRRRFGDASLITGLIGGFALFALLLGALGVFSVMSYLVAERTREIGIRVALGASRRNVLVLVLKHAFVIVGIGAGVSVTGTLLVARAAFREMVDIAGTSVALWAVVCGLLAVTAIGASLVPARRATRIEPVTALRAE